MEELWFRRKGGVLVEEQLKFTLRLVAAAALTKDGRIILEYFFGKF